MTRKKESTEPIEVQNATMWSTSITMLFGRLPKTTCWCGNCGYKQSVRFANIDFVNGWHGYPTYLCKSCKTKNYVPIGIE